MTRKRCPAAQMQLPGVTVLESAGRKIEVHNRRIPHRQIFEALRASSNQGRSIAEIYCQEVLQEKTRTISLLGRKTPARIIHTLLGYEVQASYKRIHCPDMATARYIRLFTELGCRRIRLPYDPTITEKLVPQLEAAQVRIADGIRELFPKNRAVQLYVMRRVYILIRAQLRSD